VHELIAAQARRRPQATAVVLGGERMTYGELERRANVLAHRLIDNGVGPDVLVGLCLDRSVDLVVAILGIWKAGGAYVPLDLDYPQDRLAMMVEDAELAVLVADAAGAQRLPEGRWALVRVDGGDGAGAVDADPGSRASAADLAYVVYTSGSTGRPKGVMIEHRGLTNHAQWMVDVFGLGPRDVVLQKTSVSFDASVCEFVAPLVSGGTLVLAPATESDVGEIVALCRKHGVTLIQFVPSVLAVFAEADGLEQLVSLRHLVSGGEALPSSLARRVRARLPKTTVHNCYGPTEATIDAAFHTCTDDDRGPTVPIGRPIRNGRAVVLDERLEPVGVGVPGELFVGGLGLARGYLRRPELTAEKFIPDPFEPEPGARLYRTGDLVQWRPDGSLVFLGRVDQQVKLRGFRIELGEIEAVLLEHESVAEAVVTLRDNAGEPRLVAYAVPRRDAALSASELRERLAVKLPDFMVPTAFVTLSSLPLTSNGKLDRGALPAAADPVGDGAGHVAPRDRLESELVELWQQLLGVQPIGVLDDFFALGGSSLSAMRLVARLRTSHQVELTVRSVFECPTVAALAEGLRAQMS
jgi:amino acid adenylation domain-containing protein